MIDRNELVCALEEAGVFRPNADPDLFLAWLDDEGTWRLMALIGWCGQEPQGVMDGYPLSSEGLAFAKRLHGDLFMVEPFAGGDVAVMRMVVRGGTLGLE